MSTAAPRTSGAQRFKVVSSQETPKPPAPPPSQKVLLSDECTCPQCTSNDVQVQRS